MEELPDLYSFLVEAELQHYYTTLKWVNFAQKLSNSRTCLTSSLKHEKKNENWDCKSLYLNSPIILSRNELKITAIHQLKYATDQDYRSVGFSRPEIRRLHKFYDKYCSQGYLSKIKRLLQTPVTTSRRDEVSFA